MKTFSSDDNKAPRPPQWAERFLTWYCRPAMLEDLQGDLNEYFERNLNKKGPRQARFIYILDVLKFLRLYTVRKPDFFNLYVHYIMIGSYLRTSRRSLVRNKLFSAINIVGLAVSMSVGLLVISILTDLLSYDDFQAKKDRIYRVVTSNEPKGQQAMYFASSSLKAARQMRESFTGVEDITFLHTGFSKDAKIGKDKIIPFSGLWADDSFFKVFTFPMVAGDPATALREPYSLVLTEKTAEKLFGEVDALGKVVQFDTLNYTVTGIMKDIPALSHLRFEALVSYASIENAGWLQGEKNSWDLFYSNYTYLTLPKNVTPTTLQRSLNKLSASENKSMNNGKINLSLQPLTDIMLGDHYYNEIGHNFPLSVAWVLAGLAVVVILSACFNYTNLSIARSLRRSREVGVRKVMGALKGHILAQFMAESAIISILALVFSSILFLLLRTQFKQLEQFPENLVALDLSPRIVFYFLALSLTVGVLAGFLPALFFSRMKAVQVLTNANSVKIFRRISLRKVLILTQYTFSLIFICITIVGYNQYRGFISFDLGFSTENILNIKLQGNKHDLLKKKLEEIPEVGGISRSNMVSSVGTSGVTNAKYTDPRDSCRLMLNFVDMNYLPLHRYKFVAGRNFTGPISDDETEVIVNEQVLKRFNIKNLDPHKAIGEMLRMDGRELRIVGVLKDFHYGTVHTKIEPTAIRNYKESSTNGYLNVRIKTTDWPATLERIENGWKSIDKVHPLDAKFYDEQIEQTYSEFLVMLKVVGFIAFLAICIASMGLFGMVVFTTETRLREISIRKVLGAGETGLVFLLSKGFLFLLILAMLIALPTTYFFFDQVVLNEFAYHVPISVNRMLTGVLAVMFLAFLLIGSQTLKAARSNPAKILKSE